MNPYPQPGYPQPPGGYPPYSGAPGGHYPPPGAGYQPPSAGYPPPASSGSGYPPTGSGFPPPGGVAVFPPQQPGYSQAPGGYPSPAGFGAPSPNKQFIPGGLSPGRLINITLTPGPNKFHINLRHSEGGDIAFHFNPRLPDRLVVRNSLVNGNWQNEEREQPNFPFQAGQICNIMILCEPSMFKVAVNGQHFLEFRLRTGGLHLIQLVEIEGDFTLGTFYIQ